MIGVLKYVGRDRSQIPARIFGAVDGRVEVMLVLDDVTDAELARLRSGVGRDYYSMEAVDGSDTD